jgi:hypothetical protein
VKAATESSSGALAVALKEWAVVIEALRRGEQIVLLRKGGIHEKGGRFRLEHERFVLFPTREHEKRELLAPEALEKYRDVLDAGESEEGRTLRFAAWAELADAVELGDAERAYRLRGYHVWNDAYVRMRIEYRPRQPLYAAFLRVHRLARPVEHPRVPRYAGCRSWVDLEAAIDVGGSEPVLEESKFRAELERLRVLLHG